MLTYYVYRNNNVFSHANLMRKCLCAFLNIVLVYAVHPLTLKEWFLEFSSSPNIQSMRDSVLCQCWKEALV